MAKEKQLGRVTCYPSTDDPDVIDRVEVDYKFRLVDDETGEPDPDLGEWRNASKNYHLDGSGDGKDIPAVVKTLLQARAQA